MISVLNGHSCPSLPIFRAPTLNCVPLHPSALMNTHHAHPKTTVTTIYMHTFFDVFCDVVIGDIASLHPRLVCLFACFGVTTHCISIHHAHPNHSCCDFTFVYIFLDDLLLSFFLLFSCLCHRDKYRRPCPCGHRHVLFARPSITYSPTAPIRTHHYPSYACLNIPDPLSYECQFSHILPCYDRWSIVCLHTRLVCLLVCFRGFPSCPNPKP